MIGDKVLQGLTGCATLRRRWAATSARTTSTPASRRGGSTPFRAKGEPGSETWGKLPMTFRARRRDVDRGQLRSGSQSHLLGRGAVEAVELPQPQAHAARQDALRELHRRAQPRHRQAGVVFPARAGRVVRPRRSLRARARRHRRSEGVVQRRKGRRAVEARSPHRAVPRLQGNGGAERLGPHRSEDRRAELSARHSRDAARQADLHLPEHGRRQELAGDELQRAGRTARSRRSASRAWTSRRGTCADRGRRQQRRRSGVQAHAGQQRQRRQAGRLRREDDAGSLEARAAGAVPDGGVVDGRRPGLRRRHRSLRARARREDRPGPVGNAARHVGSGIPGELRRRRPAIHRA